jgi:imidazolonepropionase
MPARAPTCRPSLDAAETIDCAGRWITPGLIDCHTHLVHGGDRAHEFELRLAGASYEEIARAGGGIVSTVRRPARRARPSSSPGPAAARCADRRGRDHHRDQVGLRPRPRHRTASMLRAARRSAGARRSSVIVTTLPRRPCAAAGSGGDKAAYIDEVCDEMLPAIAAAGLADAVDGFCEGIAFTPEQIARVFEAAKAHGLPVKLHADQLSNLHGAALAARYRRAVGRSPRTHRRRAGVAAWRPAGTVAVLLPGAFYFMRETKLPPIDLCCARHGVPIALATDCNPGTSPLTSLLLAMNMAATLFR